MVNIKANSPILPDGIELAADGSRSLHRFVVFRDNSVEPPRDIVATATGQGSTVQVEVSGPYDRGTWDIDVVPGGVFRRRFIDNNSYVPGVRTAQEVLATDGLYHPDVLLSAVNGLRYVLGRT